MLYTTDHYWYVVPPQVCRSAYLGNVSREWGAALRSIACISLRLPRVLV